MLKNFILINTLFISTTFAALAPFYHSAKEITDLLEDPALVNLVGVGTEVKSLTRDNSLIILETNTKCTLKIISTITNSDLAQAPKFKFEFGTLSCH